MDKDGDLADAADSRGELPGEPDEFDSLVLDDAFIAAGVPEASLPQYQPRPGPALPTPHDPFIAPQRRVGGFTRWTPELARRRQLRSTGFLLGAAFLLVAGVVLTGFLRLGPGQGLRGASSAAWQLPPATEFAAAAPGKTHHLAGLTPSTAVGVCFDVLHESASATMSATSCAQQHEYELIAQQRATGRNDQYPAPSYWDGTVVDRCAQQLSHYIGSVNFPAGVSAGSFNPTAAGWATGDRVVYCVAVSVPAATGSLHGPGTPGRIPTS